MYPYWYPLVFHRKVSDADPGGGLWGGRPPLGRRCTIEDLHYSIPFKHHGHYVHYWAPSSGRNPVSVPGFRKVKRCEISLPSPFPSKAVPVNVFTNPSFFGLSVAGLCSTHESLVKFDLTLTQPSRIRGELAVKIRDMSRVRVESRWSSFETELNQLDTAWVKLNH